MEQQNNQQSEIFCVFKTNLPSEYKIEENRINIPANFNEKELTQTLLELLNEEKQQEAEENPQKYQNLKFEFLIKDEFLRGSIKSHLLKHDIFSEETIQIWYTFSLQEPQKQKENEEEDWVSDLALLTSINQSKASPIIAALYNGSISVYNNQLKHIQRQQITEQSIKAIKVQQNYISQKDKEFLVYSACTDEKVRIGSLQYQKQGIQYNEIADLTGNDSSVECLDINTLRNSFIVTGNYNGGVNIYQLNEKVLEEAPQNAEERTKNKKTKLNKKQIEPLSKLTLHSDCISSVFWKDSEQIITGSFDHSIKLYDTNKNQETQVLNVKNSAATAIFPLNNFVISGQEDGIIKQIDLREQNNAPKAFKGHSGWISDIQVLESNTNLFLSSSYDHTIKIWDLRSSFPLFTIKTHHDKVLCSVWNGENMCVSGGSDNQVVSHVFQ